MRQLILLYSACCLLFSCKKENKDNTDLNNKNFNCSEVYSSEEIVKRTFKMGFSTWPFGPDPKDLDATYDFVLQHSDVYSEQIDHHIPWDALFNNKPFPKELVDNIDFRTSKRTAGKEVLLSVSLLNSERNDLLNDYNGNIPQYDSLNTPEIIDAYFKYLEYLVEQFQPQKLIYVMEANNLLLNAPEKWKGYTQLSTAIRQRLKNKYPDLQLSESITLHQWFQPETNDVATYQTMINNHLSKMDFAAISYYPFLIGQTKPEQYQTAFDFLHSITDKPITIIETGYLSKTLDLPNYGITLPGDLCMQNAYLETLAKNAQTKNYQSIIWWTHRDYDKLWKTFPEEARELGSLWLSTGLIKDNGEPKTAFNTWEKFMDKL